MPILLSILLVGVAVSRFIDNDEGGTEILQPIISQTMQRRICAELCMAGLGGDPCGEGCVDLAPANLPVQYNQTDKGIIVTNASAVHHKPRNDMCDVLCKNNLGNPLCQCNATQRSTGNYDFFEGKFILK